MNKSLLNGMLVLVKACTIGGGWSKRPAGIVHIKAGPSVHDGDGESGGPGLREPTI